MFDRAINLFLALIGFGSVLMIVETIVKLNQIDWAKLF